MITAFLLTVLITLAASSAQCLCLMFVRLSVRSSRLFPKASFTVGGSVAEWLACCTRAQKGVGSNPSRDAVG